MSNEIEFKTIEQCELRLVSYTIADSAEFSTNSMDRFPAKAARVSFGNDDLDRTAEQDNKLMQYLADHQHMTPFEYQHATFMIECPLFIRSQIHRHRTFSFNEISRRYTSDDLGFWKPTTWRQQSTANKQGSDGRIDRYTAENLDDECEQQVKRAHHTYNWMLKEGVAREQARSVLPQSLLTRFYMGGNLRNWGHFLALRLDSHAQYEVRVIADKIYARLLDLWPKSAAVVVDAARHELAEAEARRRAAGR